MSILPNKRALISVTAPASEPLTLSETKLYLRIDHSDEESLITDLIQVAREAAQQHLRKSLITQTWKLVFDDFAPEALRLPMGPVQSVTKIELFERDGSFTTLDVANYHLNAGNESLVFDICAYGHRVEITYITGYGDAVDVPSAIKYGMLAHIACLYEGRGGSEKSGLPADTIGLYAPYKEVTL